MIASISADNIIVLMLDVVRVGTIYLFSFTRSKSDFKQ